MTRTIIVRLASILVVALPANAHANFISFACTIRKVPPTESLAVISPAPVNGDVYMVFVTTDSDILAIENVQITGPGATMLYQNPFGDLANANAPNPALIPVFPSLAADSYFDTPGNTSRLGADLPGDGVTTFGDLDNNGPQTNFKIAQLTFPAGLLAGTRVSFRLSINSTDSPGTPYTRDFMCIPEPAGLALANWGLLAIASLKRRFQA